MNEFKRIFFKLYFSQELKIFFRGDVKIFARSSNLMEDNKLI